MDRQKLGNLKEEKIMACNNNLRYVSKSLRERIQAHLDRPGTSNFVRDMVERGLNMDCVDAWKDSADVAEILRDVMQDEG